jgi:hypothetical protein
VLAPVNVAPLAILAAHRGRWRAGLQRRSRPWAAVGGSGRSVDLRCGTLAPRNARAMGIRMPPAGAPGSRAAFRTRTRTPARPQGVGLSAAARPP